MPTKRKPNATPRPFSESSWLPWPDMLSAGVRIRFKILAELYELIEDAIASRTADIEKTYRAAETDSCRDRNEVEEYGEYLAEELHQLEDIKREASLLHAVSLYHRLENELKTIFAWRFNGLADPQKKHLMWRVHNWKDFQKLTKTHFSFDVASVAHFHAVNKLRCIANAVKHKQGNVTRELHGLTGWPPNRPIEVANVDLKRLREACVRFFSDFSEKAERSMEKMFGNPAKARK